MTISIKKSFCDKNIWIGRLLSLMNALQMSNFCCIASLRQGTLFIAVIEMSLTSFVLFLLLLGATHVQDIAELVAADLEQLKEKNFSFERLEELSVYFFNNEQKMASGQQLASLMMILVYSGLIVTIVHFISCLLLLYGTLRNLPQYLLPWTSTVLLSIITGFFFVVILAIIPTPGCKLGTLATGTALIALEIYAWLVVFSFYRELKS